MKLLFGLLLLAAGGPLTQAQTAAGDTLRFTLDRPGAAAVHYTLDLQAATGRGSYADTVAAATTTATGMAPGAAAGGSAAVPLRVSPELVKKAFAAVPLVKSNRCASHRKVAQTGTKTLHLVQNGADFECTYNYSEDERVNDATTLFEALAETMQYGERLQAKLRFDRLGLDGEMDALQEALSSGRALEVGNIAPVLAAVQNDDRVMDRVRRKAAHLLETAGLPAADGSAAQAPAGEGTSSR